MVLGILAVLVFVLFALFLFLGWRKTMATLDDIQAKVTAETTVIASAVTLLGELSAAIKASVNDPVALQAISDSIDAQAASLAAAVAANTPAAPAAPAAT